MACEDSNERDGQTRERGVKIEKPGEIGHLAIPLQVMTVAKEKDRKAIRREAEEEEKGSKQQRQTGRD